MISQFIIAIILLISFAVITPAPQGCSFPPAAANFRNKDYEGEWFEIGKIQTKGGAFFEKDCVCTEINILPNDVSIGEYIADNDCRSLVVDGPWTNITGLLHDEDLTKPGKWLETISGSTVNYTVIAIGDDFSVEYDCGTSAGVTNYCVHVLSRQRTMNMTLFYELMQNAIDMGLNPQDLPITITTQDGC